jgi:purine nucleosidase
MDHDGGVDDVAALAMILSVKGIDLRAVAITPADSFKEPAIAATRALLQFLGAPPIPVVASNNQGTNPFPDDWRKDSIRVADLPELKALETSSSEAPPAVAKILELLSGPEPYDILETGPLTNVAEALLRQPNLRKKIRRIVVMGGAVNVKGNVVMPGHDGSAEWNFYNNPKAAQIVLSSGIPITLVALDATNQVPVTREFMARLKAQQSFRVSKLFYEAWGVIAAKIEAGHYEDSYYFWDTLAAAVFLRPDIVKIESKKLVVMTTGPSQGRVMEAKDGHAVDVATVVDKRRLYDLILQLFRK